MLGENKSEAQLASTAELGEEGFTELAEVHDQHALEDAKHSDGVMEAISASINGYGGFPDSANRGAVE